MYDVNSRPASTSAAASVQNTVFTYSTIFPERNRSFSEYFDFITEKTSRFTKSLRTYARNNYRRFFKRQNETQVSQNSQNSQIFETIEFREKIVTPRPNTSCNRIPKTPKISSRQREENFEECFLANFQAERCPRSVQNVERHSIQSATLPRRNRTNNLNCGGSGLSSNHLNCRRLLHPKSLQNLSAVEIDRILTQSTYPPYIMARRNSSRRNVNLNPRNEVESNDERIAKTLSRLNKSLSKEIGSYAPGRVHYEREYRIYGKDTVALIYYKTCYLWFRFSFF